jgi:hypothetical protein
MMSNFEDWTETQDMVDNFNEQLEILDEEGT